MTVVVLTTTTVVVPTTTTGFRHCYVNFSTIFWGGDAAIDACLLSQWLCAFASCYPPQCMMKLVCKASPLPVTCRLLVACCALLAARCLLSWVRLACGLTCTEPIDFIVGCNHRLRRLSLRASRWLVFQGWPRFQLFSIQRRVDADDARMALLR